MSPTFGQAHRVHQKGPDDGGVQALVVQHHDRVVEARRRVHHIAAREGLGRDVAHVRRHIAQAVHARQVVVAEGGDGAPKMVDLQTRCLRPLQHKGQQLQFVEDAQHECAVADVVAGQRWLVVLVAPLDLGHLVVGVADLFAFTQQLLRHRFEAERSKAPHARPQRFNAIDHHAPGHGREQVALAARVSAPCDGPPLAPQQQRHGVGIGGLLQHPQIELDHVPADDDVGVVGRKPGIELLDHVLASGAVDQPEILRWRCRLCGLPQHEHHPVTCTVECDRVQLFGGAGLDVQRHHLQRRAPIGRWLQPAVEEGRPLAKPPFDQHTGGDEALHQVSVVRAHIRLIQRNLQRLEGARQLAEIAEPAGIDAEHGFLLEGLQTKLFQLQALQALQIRQLGLHRSPMAGRYEGDRGLLGQQHLDRPYFGGNPILDLGALGEIAPVAGEDEAREFGGGEG